MIVAKQRSAKKTLHFLGVGGGKHGINRARTVIRKLPTTMRYFEAKESDCFGSYPALLHFENNLVLGALV